MSEAQAKQERMGAVVMSLGSVFIAVMEWIDRPEAGEIVEAEPDWYVTFNLALHGAILLLLLFALLRLPRMVADRPGLKGPFLAMILVGIVAAAYVVGRDLGLV
ncbi:hypothetical protein [Rhodobacter sp. SY28-1]|uniref:hypothetical protein n=1 Tax=Rhodobacter sp. SY28-1 TaxID=2562317 RepID=UPI0010BFC5B2|nr:hypothetical protein [Rhodobacter sp. SY28-1]